MAQAVTVSNIPLQVSVTNMSADQMRAMLAQFTAPLITSARNLEAEAVIQTDRMQKILDQIRDQSDLSEDILRENEDQTDVLDDIKKSVENMEKCCADIKTAFDAVSTKNVDALDEIRKKTRLTTDWVRESHHILKDIHNSVTQGTSNIETSVNNALSEFSSGIDFGELERVLTRSVSEAVSGMTGGGGGRGGGGGVSVEPVGMNVPPDGLLVRLVEDQYSGVVTQINTSSSDISSQIGNLISGLGQYFGNLGQLLGAGFGNIKNISTGPSVGKQVSKLTGLVKEQLLQLLPDVFNTLPEIVSIEIAKDLEDQMSSMMKFQLRSAEGLNGEMKTLLTSMYKAEELGLSAELSDAHRNMVLAGLSADKFLEKSKDILSSTDSIAKRTKDLGSYINDVNAKSNKTRESFTNLNKLIDKIGDAAQLAGVPTFGFLLKSSAEIDKNIQNSATSMFGMVNSGNDVSRQLRIQAKTTAESSDYIISMEQAVEGQVRLYKIGIRDLKTQNDLLSKLGNLSQEMGVDFNDIVENAGEMAFELKLSGKETVRVVRGVSDISKEFGISSDKVFNIQKGMKDLLKTIRDVHGSSAGMANEMTRLGTAIEKGQISNLALDINSALASFPDFLEKSGEFIQLWPSAIANAQNLLKQQGVIIDDLEAKAGKFSKTPFLQKKFIAGIVLSLKDLRKQAEGLPEGAQQTLIKLKTAGRIVGLPQLEREIETLGESAKEPTERLRELMTLKPQTENIDKFREKVKELGLEKFFKDQAIDLKAKDLDPKKLSEAFERILKQNISAVINETSSGLEELKKAAGDPGKIKQALQDNDLIDTLMSLQKTGVSSEIPELKALPNFINSLFSSLQSGQGVNKIQLDQIVKGLDTLRESNDKSLQKLATKNVIDESKKGFNELQAVIADKGVEVLQAEFLRGIISHLDLLVPFLFTTLTLIAAADTIKDGIKLWKDYGPAIKGLGPKISGSISTLGSSLSGKFASIGKILPVLGTKMAQFMPTFMSFGSSILPALSGISSSIVSSIAGLLSLIGGYLMTAATSIGGLLTSAIALIGPALITALPVIIAAAIGAAAGFALKKAFDFYYGKKGDAAEKRAMKTSERTGEVKSLHEEFKAALSEGKINKDQYKELYGILKSGQAKTFDEAMKVLDKRNEPAQVLDKMAQAEISADEQIKSQENNKSLQKTMQEGSEKTTKGVFTGNEINQKILDENEKQTKYLDLAETRANQALKEKQAAEALERDKETKALKEKAAQTVIETKTIMAQADIEKKTNEILMNPNKTQAFSEELRTAMQQNKIDQAQYDEFVKIFNENRESISTMAEAQKILTKRKELAEEDKLVKALGTLLDMMAGKFKIEPKKVESKKEELSPSQKIEPSILQREPYKEAHGYQKGGTVPGHGSIDSVFAKLSPGEFVIPEKYVESVMEMLRNSSDISDFADKISPNIPGVGGSQMDVEPRAGFGQLDEESKDDRLDNLQSLGFINVNTLEMVKLLKDIKKALEPRSQGRRGGQLSGTTPSTRPDTRNALAASSESFFIHNAPWAGSSPANVSAFNAGEDMGTG